MNLPTRDDVLLRLVAPIGGVTSGVPILIGGMLVIPENTELVNVIGDLAGVVPVAPKAMVNTTPVRK